MFELHISQDCGISYHKEAESESLEELRPKMEEADRDILRWYLTKDGKDYWDEVCAIHSGIVNLMLQLNSTKE